MAVLHKGKPLTCAQVSHRLGVSGDRRDKGRKVSWRKHPWATQCGKQGEGHKGSQQCGLSTPGLETSGNTPVPVGELALAGGHEQDVVNLVLNVEGVL